MPLYEFQDVETGQCSEVYLPMAQAPEIGSETVISGRKLRRLVSHIEPAAKKTVEFRSVQLPNNWPYARRHDENGRPYFSSRREVEESVQRSKDTSADTMVYDP